MFGAFLSFLHALGEFWGYTLCRECRNLDLRRAVSLDNLQQMRENGSLVSRVGNRFKYAPVNDCPLCEILFTNRLEPLEGDNVCVNGAIAVTHRRFNRARGILITLLILFVLVFGPATIAGWLIFFLGNTVVVDGGWHAFKNLNRFDRLTILIIVTAMGYHDAERGITIGICLAFITLLLQSFRISPDISDHSGETGDELRAFPFVQWLEGIDNTYLRYTCVSLCIVPESFTRGEREPATRMIQHFKEHGYNICYNVLPPPKLYPRIRMQGFDSRLVLAWLDDCRTHHKSCSLQQRDQVAGLKLIDCETDSLISASAEMQYVALSYVWGQSQNTPARVKGLKITKSRLPPVIVDAIQVTKSLNFRYLWIDQYCIPQDDPTAKLLQIKQMNKVYQNAEVTIVAAAGNDQTYGLPGVGFRTKKAQKTVRTGRYRITQTMDAHREIRSSKWFTRAWTFQEGLLSRRRLIFTDSEVCYECNVMSCTETISSSQKTLHDLELYDKYESATFSVGRIFKGHNHDVSPYRSVLQLQQLLGQYTARNLTYDDDSLEAFLGVLRDYEEKCGMRHLWGIPFFPLVKVVGDPFFVGDPRLDSKIDGYLAAGLCWIHKHNCWEGKDLWPKRRSKFPSWSWAGWAGTVQHEREHHEYDQPLLVRHLEITTIYDGEPQQSVFCSWLRQVVLEIETGEQMRFEDHFYDESSDRRFSYSKAILFNTNPIPPEAYNILPNYGRFGQFLGYQWVVGDIPAFVNVSQGPSSNELLGALRSQELEGILIGVKDGMDRGLPSCKMFILIVSLSAGTALRRGIIVLHARCGYKTIEDCFHEVEL